MASYQEVMGLHLAGLWYEAPILLSICGDLTHLGTTVGFEVLAQEGL